MGRLASCNGCAELDVELDGIVASFAKKRVGPILLSFAQHEVQNGGYSGKFHVHGGQTRYVLLLKIVAELIRGLKDAGMAVRLAL